MVISCCRTAFYETQQKHAHPTFVTLQMLEQIRFAVWRGALKIRVSLVRFQSRPPNKKPPLAKAGGGFVLEVGWTGESNVALWKLSRYLESTSP